MIEETETRVPAPLYVPTTLAIIIPTKDRPDEVRRLLQSITELDCEVGRIIVVASGQDIRTVVMAFAEKLPVEYYTSKPGQIRQRNKGIALLNESTYLVATIDDDAEFHKTAVTGMINFWNRVEPETAGVGFNIVTIKGHRHSFVKGLLGISVPEPGRVLKSGNNTAITNINNDIRSEWLTGGATVWRQEILQKYPHHEIMSRWSVCEDLIFSYPISKKYPLYVSVSSKINIGDVKLENEDSQFHRFRGRTSFLWGLYFVLNNKHLSLVSFSLFKFIEITSMMIKGIFYKEYYRLFWAAGALSGVILSLTYFIRNKDIIELIEKNT